MQTNDLKKKQSTANKTIKINHKSGGNLKYNESHHRASMMISLMILTLLANVPSNDHMSFILYHIVANPILGKLYIGSRIHHQEK